MRRGSAGIRATAVSVPADGTPASSTAGPGHTGGAAKIHDGSRRSRVGGVPPVRRAMLFVTYGRGWLIIVTETKGTPPARALWPFSSAPVSFTRRRSACSLQPRPPVLRTHARAPTLASLAPAAQPTPSVSRSRKRGHHGARELGDKIPRTHAVGAIGIPRFSKLVSSWVDGLPTHQASVANSSSADLRMRTPLSTCTALSEPSFTSR